MLRTVLLALAVCSVSALYNCPTQSTVIHFSNTPQVIPPREQDNHYVANINCAYNIDVPAGYYVRVDFEGNLKDSRGSSDELRISADYGVYRTWISDIEGSYVEILPSQFFVSLWGSEYSSGTFRMTVTYKKQATPMPAKIVQVPDNGYAVFDVTELNTNNVVTFKSSPNTQASIMYNGDYDYSLVAANVYVYDGEGINGKFLGNLNHASAVIQNSTHQTITVYYACEDKFEKGMLFANDQKNLDQFSDYHLHYDPTSNYHSDTLSSYNWVTDKPAGVTYYQPGGIPMKFTKIFRSNDGAKALKLFEGVPVAGSVPFAVITIDNANQLLPMTIDKQVVTMTLDEGFVEVQMWPDFPQTGNKMH